MGDQVTLEIFLPCDRCRVKPQNDMVFSRVEWGEHGEVWRQFALCDKHLPLTPRVLIWRHQWRIGRICASLLGLGIGMTGCLKCATPWDCVRSHSTTYSGSSGCFPLCERCWDELTPTQRLPYYRKLIDLWNDEMPWPLIEAAVLAGL